MIMASPNTTTNGQIQPRTGGAAVARPRNESGLVGLLQSMGPEIARALPRHLTPERMARVCLTALRTIPHLGECSAPSFAACIMSASQLGLEVNTPIGEAYLIPRQMKGKWEATLIVGYQGFLALARRSGQVKDIYACVVRKGDTFHYELGLDRTLRHIPSDDDASPITHAYAVADLGDGIKTFVVLTKRQIDSRRPKHATSGPWSDHYAAMAQKTAIRELYKWIPKSIEMASAMRIDETVERGGVVSDGADPSVIDVLQAGGLREDPTGYDADTGEVVDAPTEAELAAMVDRGEA